ncbi:MAG TPA: hypothetical protein VJZ27_07910 [Aggregatilineales bacterium]|nr:hypothetical protein [Aggregatilineales bacterium]
MPDHDLLDENERLKKQNRFLTTVIVLVIGAALVGVKSLGIDGILWSNQDPASATLDKQIEERKTIEAVATANPSNSWFDHWATATALQESSFVPSATPEAKAIPSPD